ncbi:MAG: 50S ribosomal protein L6, partial [Polyangiales bacterium]
METTQTAFKVSRVGKRPVPVPDGVQVSIADGQVQAKGPQGAHQVRLPKEVSVLQQDKTLVVEPKSEYGKRALQFHGTVRASLNNLMQGVHQGFKVALDLYGVGYRAELKGQSLTMALGLSHSVQMELPASVKAKVE